MKLYIVRPYNILKIYFCKVLLKQTQVVFVLNMLILINGKLAFETSAYVLLLLYQSSPAKWYD